MTDQHPITPSPEQVEQWGNECVTADMPDQVYIATQAARWGADQGLEAMLAELKALHLFNAAYSIRAARRPKPPSLKEQALDVLSKKLLRCADPEGYDIPMTIDKHPITPPPELVKQWADIWYQAKVKHVDIDQFVATQAARWGADQELEACCEWLKVYGYLQRYNHYDLRAARRSKPPSLKEQSIALLDKIQGSKQRWQLNELDIIRRALEALPDDN